LTVFFKYLHSFVVVADVKDTVFMALQIQDWNKRKHSCIKHLWFNRSYQELAVCKYAENNNGEKLQLKLSAKCYCYSSQI